MRNLLAPVFALLVVTFAYGGAALPGVDDAAVDLPTVPEAGAPGPYVGPVDDALIPDGWHRWSDDDIHRQCGKVDLVFANPDLQHDENGLIHAAGRFFIQFQAVVNPEDPPDGPITRFSFSFGKSDMALDSDQTYDLLNCNSNLPDSPLGQGTAGAYLLFYRSDFTAEDGFFVPIETTNVPDGVYAAAVHAYTGESPNYVEVGRAWGLAEVKNCDGPSAPNACPQDSPEAVIANDIIMPWPIVLPGDGEQTNDGIAPGGLTIEILDIDSPLEWTHAFLNGEEIELVDWETAPRDRDLVPLNDDTDCPAGQNIRSVCEHVVYSSGWKWEGGQIQVGDVLRVEAVDANGNRVTKGIHVGFTSGGTVTSEVPLIDFETLSPDSETVMAGEPHAFNLRLKNVGGADAHVNLLLDYNQTYIYAKWTNVENDHGHADATHVQIAPGQQSILDVEVTTTSGTPKATYPIKAILEYPAAGQTVTMERELFLTVESLVDPNATAAPNTTVAEKKVEDSPGLGFAAVAVGFVAVAAVAAGRRRL